MLPDGLDLIQSFVTVAEELNFRRAAERLHLDQSALSRRIQKLEHLLGFALFERTTRDVSLTPAGRVFYEQNAQLLHRYKDTVAAARQVAEGKAGQLRIGYMAFAATELMPQTVARFQRSHPQVNVQMRYLRTQGQKLALARNEIDVGYMIGPFEHSEVKTTLLASDRLYVVTPRNHPLARQHTVRPADLAEHDLIFGDMIEWESYRWRINDLFNREGVELHIKLEASNTLALLGLVAAGLGVTVYPACLIGYLGHNVELRPIMHPDFEIQTILAWPRNNHSEILRKFIAEATNLPVKGLRGSPRASNSG